MPPIVVQTDGVPYPHPIECDQHDKPDVDQKIDHKRYRQFLGEAMASCTLEGHYFSADYSDCIERFETITVQQGTLIEHLAVEHGEAGMLWHSAINVLNEAEPGDSFHMPTYPPSLDS